jgi:Protein of unknown function (DUF1566)
MRRAVSRARWLASRSFAALCAVIGTSLPLAAQQRCDTSAYPLSAPTERFEDHADGTVTDKRSQLMWLRCAGGQRWSASQCSGAAKAMNWQDAQAFAAEINKQGSFFYADWRLPKVHELATIAERQCSNPRINLAVFPGTPAAAFWSASARPADRSETGAFVLGFGADGVSYEDRTELHFVRLVRTGP